MRKFCAHLMSILFVSCGFAFGQDSGGAQGPTFQIIEGNFTWQEAKADAEARGGRLAVFKSKDRLDAALDVLTIPRNENFFIGLKRKTNSDEFEWINGSSLSYNWWAPGWPQLGDVYGILEHIPPHKFASTNGNGTFGYILEIPVVELEPSITFYPTENSNGIEINATVTAERVEDRFGVANKAFKLNGFGDIITDENFELNGSSMSFSLWLKVDRNQPATYPNIFRFGDYDGWPSIGLGINRNTNILQAQNDVRSGVQTNVGAQSPLELGSWYHAVIIVENNKYYLHLNGNLVGSNDLQQTTITGPKFATGYTPWVASIDEFYGTLDEIKVFNYALDADSIEALANGQIPEPLEPALPDFTNFNFSSGDFSQWTVGGIRMAFATTQIVDDPQAENGKAAFVKEWTSGVSVRTPAFVPVAGDVAFARYYNPGSTSSCGFFVYPTGGNLIKLEEIENSSYVTKNYDLTPWAGQEIQVGFQGGQMQIDYLEIKRPEPLEPAPPVVEFESFYESNSGETIVIDATPTEGYPTNFTYQWTFNGFPVPAFLGGADATLSLNGTSDQNGTWRVQVTNSEGSAEASFEYRVFVDNDSDTLSNYREENITLTNPNLADSDSDGLSDPEEIAAETDPNIADTDEDGVSDGAEVNTYASNPKKKDTDDDGLSDGDEINTYLSNPNNSDSDSDGISDASEVAAGLDLNTADTIASAVAFLTEELANRPDGFDEAMALSRSAGQNDVTSNPSTYGLYGESAYNAIILERDARFLDSDEDGITDEKEAELETDASSETVFYLQEGLDSATANARAAGRSDVTTNPLDYALTTKAAYDGVVTERDARPTQAESDAAVSQARVAGRSDVIIDPASYSLFSAEAYTAVVAERDARPSLAAYNTAIVESLATGRSSVTNNPGDYGLYQAAEYNAVVAERDARPTQEAYTAVVAERDTRFLDSDEDGITDEKEAELETDTSKETVFYLQGALDTATADARSSGRSDVTTNPLDYALITKAAYDIVVAERDERPTVLACDTAVVEALSAGRLSVTSNPSEYGLYDSVAYNTVVAERDLRPTINAYNTAVADALTAGRLSVTTNPSGYGLYNAASYNAIIAERDARPSQAALDAVIAERDARPTPDQIKDARLGSVVLVPNIIEENEQIVQIRFRIEESNDLGIWESRQEVAEVNIPIKPGKKFYRFSVNED
ncbi:hypothetical protein N8577_01125 [Akkermansiaceae bacterium]|nr:hypothetical protein [Akkermansiaceae bacterium]